MILWKNVFIFVHWLFSLNYCIFILHIIIRVVEKQGNIFFLFAQEKRDIPIRTK